MIREERMESSIKRYEIEDYYCDDIGLDEIFIDTNLYDSINEYNQIINDGQYLTITEKRK